MPSGFEIGPAVLRDDQPRDVYLPGVLIDVDLGDHRDVAVVAFVADAGDAAAADDAGRRRVRLAATAAPASCAAFAAVRTASLRRA